jgi:thiosulfate/3-mercaptopyruvate sulfurtransferase
VTSRQRSQQTIHRKLLQRLRPDEAIPTAQLLQPEEFVQMLRSSVGEKPLVLQVGSHILYAEAHIPGSEYVGAGGQDAGLQALRDRVKGLERSGFLVIYCGCCPWNKCPNIRPAYRELHALGFTHVKVLYIADNFGADWVNNDCAFVPSGQSSCSEC